MNNKKEVKDWYLAANHFLTAGFVVPFILGFVLRFFAIMVVGGYDHLTWNIIISIIWILSISLGVIYSSRYVNKKYLIKRSENIAKLATIYFVILVGGYRLFQVLQRLAKGLIISRANPIIEGVTLLIGAVIFYQLSKRYIKDSKIKQK
jgi:hypothetical protein